MNEFGLALGIAALLAGGVLCHIYFPFQALLAGGVLLVALGLGIGVPTGFWYHVLLYRFLKPKMELPKYWWFSPGGLYDHLSDEESERCRPWLILGAGGFFAALAGCALVAVSLLG